MCFNEEKPPSTLLAPPTFKEQPSTTYYKEDSVITIPPPTSCPSHQEECKTCGLYDENSEMVLPFHFKVKDELAWSLFPCPHTAMTDFAKERANSWAGILKDEYVYVFPREEVG